jgi:hypothetical protein
MARLEPRPGFDWSRVNWLGPDQPMIADGEDCEGCSYCGDAIAEDRVPLRLFNELGWGAEFCAHSEATWWGIQSFDDSVEPRDEPEVRRRGQAGRLMARRETCRGAGEVPIDRNLNIVWRLEEAVLLIPCPAGCISGVASCCDGACGGPRDVTNEEKADGWGRVARRVGR